MYAVRNIGDERFVLCLRAGLRGDYHVEVGRVLQERNLLRILKILWVQFGAQQFLAVGGIENDDGLSRHKNADQRGIDVVHPNPAAAFGKCLFPDIPAKPGVKQGEVIPIGVENSSAHQRMTGVMHVRVQKALFKRLDMAVAKANPSISLHPVRGFLIHSLRHRLQQEEVIVVAEALGVGTYVGPRPEDVAAQRIDAVQSRIVLQASAIGTQRPNPVDATQFIRVDLY